MIPRIVLLITAGLAFLALIGLPARWLGGDVVFLHCVTAVLLCLVPAVATLAWTYWSMTRDARRTPLLALGGTGVRMFAVLLVALLLNMQVPLYHDQSFLFWVLGAYLFLLAVEIALLLVGQPRQGLNPPGSPGA